MESILTSIKKMLGITEEYEHFDSDLMMHINSVLGILVQLGVGSDDFAISGKEDTWADFIGSDVKRYEMIKSFVHLKVKLLFDPPLSSAVMEAMNRMALELEWRIKTNSESDEN